ncbi:MAG: alpha-galactosidase [Lachnospiraceae bacterium]|nr:alpha-galactosidase [Lachnospiraceae bacterium]
MSIRFDENIRIFYLNTVNSEYQIKIDEYGVALHTYYGKPVGNTDMSYLITEMDRGFSGNLYEARDRRGVSPDTLPTEYSTYGAGDFRLSAAGIIADNGSRTYDLRYVSHDIKSGKEALKGLPYVRAEKDKVDTLEIKLEDKIIGLEVTLIYNVFEEKNVITRSARFANKSEKTITLTKAASMSMDIQYADLDIIEFHGRHAMERQTERRELGHDIHVISSKRGTSSHHHNPFVILCDHNADEDNGLCYGFMLVYSGNHAEEIEKDQAGSVRVVSGISGDGFAWKLGNGEDFQTPEVILACTENGLNDLSYIYHRIIRENVCPAEFRDMKRPVLINNWEGTYFDFDEEKIMGIAKSASEIGCEMLVLDDGWFGVRNDDNSGLGDWFVNIDKLPGGIKKIADYTNSLGMKFGLWFEPEMVNEDSDLYRNHPDWALKDPDRKPVMGRNQLVLDMSRKEVIDYLFDSISKILDSANIEYVKWDFNRSMANIYSFAADSEKQGEIAHRFMLGTYDLMQRLRDRYPKILIEGCSGGGGRFDAGILFYSPQIWCSDNSDAINRLKIQKGTSYGYPVSSMGAHVSASPNHQNGRVVPIETRAIVAMSGTFGYELDPRKLSEEDKATIKKQIEEFNRFYTLIQKGRYYRLTTDRQEGYYVAWQFVSEDKSEALLNVVATDVQGNPEIPFVRLKGLDAEAEYEIDYVKLSTGTTAEGGTNNSKTGKSFSGSALMHGGYATGPMFGVYPALQIHFKRK